MSSKKSLWFVLALAIFTVGWVVKARWLSSTFPTPTPQSSSTKLNLAASFYPLAEFAHQVGGENVNVTNLVPAGVEPHDFEPSPHDLVTIQTADLFIYNGAGLETWLDKLGDDIKGKNKMVNASQGIELLPAADSPSRVDPHVWMSPVLASQEVSSIKQALVSVDPAHQATYELNAGQYQAQLAQLDTEFRTGLANCQRRDIVTSHNAFQYLAKEYGLNVVSISGLSPDEEPSAQKLAEVADFAKTHDIHSIFFETLVSPKLSQTIAQETGAQTLVFIEFSQ